jgi:hypothetical protein
MGHIKNMIESLVFLFWRMGLCNGSPSRWGLSRPGTITVAYDEGGEIGGCRGYRIFAGLEGALAGDG